MQQQTSARGFTLVEVMVALVLGLLLSAGVLSLFNSTSQTNKAQSALARLQENGRFAITRMESDLRMTGGQYCSNFAGMANSGATVVPVGRLRAPAVFTPDLGWPGIHSINGGVPSAADATLGYLLSPRWFVAGYSSANAPADLPIVGTSASQRLDNSDVLTVRYQRGSGWPAQFTSSCGELTLNPQTGDDPLNFGTPPPSGRIQNVLVTDCINPQIFSVTSAAGSVLTLGALANAAGAQAACGNDGSRDKRAFNFNADFVTVDYYLAFREDRNPDARLNSPTATTRVIPVLIRRENGGAEQELVQGVDQLEFRYGVQDMNGRTHFMTAAEVDAGGALCPPPPEGTQFEPGCLWRAVRTIEAHLLVNSVDDAPSLGSAANEYHFLDAAHTVTASTPLPSGVTAGNMLRREFVGYASNRNYNF